MDQHDDTSPPSPEGKRWKKRDDKDDNLTGRGRNAGISEIEEATQSSSVDIV